MSKDTKAAHAPQPDKVVEPATITDRLPGLRWILKASYTADSQPLPAVEVQLISEQTLLALFGELAEDATLNVVREFAVEQINRRIQDHKYQPLHKRLCADDEAKAQLTLADLLTGNGGGKAVKLTPDEAKALKDVPANQKAKARDWLKANNIPAAKAANVPDKVAAKWAQALADQKRQAEELLG